MLKIICLHISRANKYIIRIPTASNKFITAANTCGKHEREILLRVQLLVACADACMNYYRNMKIICNLHALDSPLPYSNISARTGF